MKPPRIRACRRCTAPEPLAPAECLNLKWTDIDFNRRIIKVLPYFNKQKVETTPVLTKPAMEALNHYKDICDELGLCFAFLFPSMESHGPISSDRMGKIFRAHAKEAGILAVDYISDNGQPQYNYSLYSGRHWFGTTVFKKTHSDAAVQFLMRHRNRASAERYIELDKKDIEIIADNVF